MIHALRANHYDIAMIRFYLIKILIISEEFKITSCFNRRLKAVLFLLPSQKQKLINLPLRPLRLRGEFFIK